MMPEDRLSDVAVPGDWFAPDDIAREPLEDYELGGVALNDASQGLQVQSWRLRMEGHDAMLSPEPYSAEQVLWTNDTGEAEIEIALAFDKNMDWYSALETNTGKVYFRWYDSQQQGHVVSEYIGAKSPRLCFDDKRPEANSWNDVILYYCIGADLYFRQQRERFGVEHHLGNFSGYGYLGRVGMTDEVRVQIELLSGRASSGGINTEWEACDVE